MFFKTKHKKGEKPVLWKMCAIASSFLLAFALTPTLSFAAEPEVPGTDPDSQPSSPTAESTFPTWPAPHETADNGRDYKLGDEVEFVVYANLPENLSAASNAVLLTTFHDIFEPNSMQIKDIVHNGVDNIDGWMSDINDHDVILTAATEAETQGAFRFTFSGKLKSDYDLFTLDRTSDGKFIVPSISSITINDENVIPTNTTDIHIVYEAPIVIKKTSGMTEFTTDVSAFSLSGAKYGIYSDISCSSDTLLEEVTTDEGGVATTKTYTAGSYYVSEIESSYGYRLDPNIYIVNIDNKTIDKDGRVPLTVTEDPQRGDITIIKYGDYYKTGDEGATAEQSVLLPNVSFNIINDNEFDVWSYETNSLAAPGDVIYTLTTGDNGTITTSTVPQSSSADEDTDVSDNSDQGTDEPTDEGTEGETGEGGTGNEPTEGEPGGEEEVPGEEVNGGEEQPQDELILLSMPSNTFAVADTDITDDNTTIDGDTLTVVCNVESEDDAVFPQTIERNGITYVLTDVKTELVTESEGEAIEGHYVATATYTAQSGEPTDPGTSDDPAGDNPEDPNAGNTENPSDTTNPDDNSGGTGQGTSPDKGNIPTGGTLPLGTYKIHEVEETVPTGYAPAKEDMVVTLSEDGGIRYAEISNQTGTALHVDALEVNTENHVDSQVQFQLLDANKQPVDLTKLSVAANFTTPDFSTDGYTPAEGQVIGEVTTTGDGMPTDEDFTSDEENGDGGTGEESPADEPTGGEGETDEGSGDSGEDVPQEALDVSSVAYSTEDGLIYFLPDDETEYAGDEEVSVYYDVDGLLHINAECPDLVATLAEGEEAPTPETMTIADLAALEEGGEPFCYTCAEVVVQDTTQDTPATDDEQTGDGTDSADPGESEVPVNDFVFAEGRNLDQSGAVLATLPAGSEQGIVTTDNNGSVMLPVKLPAGTYYVANYTTPEGWILVTTDPVEVTIDETTVGTWEAPVVTQLYYQRHLAAPAAEIIALGDKIAIVSAIIVLVSGACLAGYYINRKRKQRQMM